MDSAAKRPWYRLHWGTVLTVFFVGAGWVIHIFSGTLNALLFHQERYPFTPYADGWPISAIIAYPAIAVRPVALVLDLLVMFVCLISTAFVVERLDRGNKRFSVATLVAFVTSIGMVLGFWQWNADQQIVLGMPPLGSGYGYAALRFRGPSQGAIPLFFALGCTFYSVTYFALRAVSFISSHRRPALAKEADGSPAQ